MSSLAVNAPVLEITNWRLPELASDGAFVWMANPLYVPSKDPGEPKVFVQTEALGGEVVLWLLYATTS
jgi:hypothetical protein